MVIVEMTPGTSFSRSAGGTGRRAMWQWIHSIGSEAENGRLPVTISYSVTPRPYRSLRESSDRFIRPVCSGAMYARVPAITSGGAGAARSRRMREAMPNPVSRTSPLAAATRTLPGLMSLWIRPAS